MEIIGYKDKHEYTNKHGITSVVYLMDCMDLLKQVPDKYFELAVVDPPYRDDNQPTKEMRNKIGGKMKEFGRKPKQEYFKGLFNASNNQIVWGANNFIEYLYSTNCWLFWYKNNPMDNYSDGEFAWTSLSSVSKCIPIEHYGSNTRDKNKIHPTQKPVALYEWLFKNYAKPNDKILDTHLGSGSSRIAADKANLPFVGCELDPDYFYASVKRFKEYAAQQTMF